MPEVDFNEAFFERLGRSPEVTGLCEDVGNKVAAVARASAPRDTNEYANSIHVEVVSRGRRNAVLVKADSPIAMLVESKTGNLARALNQVKKSG
ncbi:hypothetical protein [Paenarthrobacter nicotinovorans]|uniref:hypothetical protein n=1 Tax=Paenarthrobacter nicotinovorans TaxID=29320 RepID=UPI002485C18B|nr:hypothetical protein [Paenarthrobacter nicotinovorans]MDI2019701.1 hypothetical protein [Paenarthrobacter nicotinovorans]